MEITSDWKPGSVKKSVGFSVKRHSAVLFKCDICSNTFEGATAETDYKEHIKKCTYISIENIKNPITVDTVQYDLAEYCDKGDTLDAAELKDLQKVDSVIDNVQRVKEGTKSLGDVMKEMVDCVEEKEHIEYEKKYKCTCCEVKLKWQMSEAAKNFDKIEHQDDTVDPIQVLFDSLEEFDKHLLDMHGYTVVREPEFSVEQNGIKIS